MSAPHGFLLVSWLLCIFSSLLSAGRRCVQVDSNAIECHDFMTRELQHLSSGIECAANEMTRWVGISRTETMETTHT